MKLLVGKTNDILDACKAYSILKYQVVNPICNKN